MWPEKRAGYEAEERRALVDPAVGRKPEAMMLSIVQILEFELGVRCNLCDEHAACPNTSPERFADDDEAMVMTDDQIVSCAVQAYEELGFTGLIGWIYYEEPLLYKERMFRLMAEIKSRTGRARFILWTNGMLIEQDVARYDQFEQIVISGYNEYSLRGAKRLVGRQLPLYYAVSPTLDSRLQRRPPQFPDQPCVRPFVEFIFDAFGNQHLCCYAWRASEVVGCIHDTPFIDLVKRWRDTLPLIVGRRMESGAPECCRLCGYRWERYQTHDKEIVKRARKYVEGVEHAQMQSVR